MATYRTLHPRSIFKLPNLYAQRTGSLRHGEIVGFMGIPVNGIDYQWRELSTGGWVAYQSMYSKEVFFEEMSDIVGLE